MLPTEPPTPEPEEGSPEPSNCAQDNGEPAGTPADSTDSRVGNGDSGAEIDGEYEPL